MKAKSQGASRAMLKGPRRDVATEADFDAISEASDGAATANARPARFEEKAFVTAIVKLCDSGQYEKATHYFMRECERLLATKINAKDKFNHFIYLPKLIQAGAGTKHGYQKLLRKAGRVEQVISGLEVPPGGSFIDLGCGAHDPLALATYYYLNGFSPCYGIDLLPMRNELYSALSMYDILVNAKSFPRRYCRAGVEPGQILRRMGEFSLGRFERGDFKGGLTKLSDKVMFESVDIITATIPADSVSLIASFAVLEHVSDIGGVCNRIFELLKPGGVVYHFVDLADHRAYRGDGEFGPLSFLADAEAPANMNRLRAPEIVEAHRRAGFEIVSESRGTVEMPEAIRMNLQPRFKQMSIEELSAIKLDLVVRRPA